MHLFDLSTGERAFLDPRSLRSPVGAVSFAEILGQKLRSVFCLFDFQCSTRGMSPLPTGVFPAAHFAQTFPLHRRGRPLGGLAWLAADPRPGVELDLRQLPLSVSPQAVAHGWALLQRAFGVTNPDLRVYICPAQHWPLDNMGLVPTMPTIDDSASMTGWERAEAEARAVWTRAELESHLQYEAALWEQNRNIRYWVSGDIALQHPKYRCESPEEKEIFEAMEKVPCTAVGWWLFSAEALQPVDSQGLTFRAAVRPGLFLFDV